MTNDERAYEIRNLLREHAHPALRGMDRERIAQLAEQIMRIATDRRLWTKWSGDRETLAERAAEIWIPMEDLREALNALPGPQLTEVDVEQRIREFREKPYSGSYPRSEVEVEALVNRRAKGTPDRRARGTPLRRWQIDAAGRPGAVGGGAASSVGGLISGGVRRGF